MPAGHCIGAGRLVDVHADPARATPGLEGRRTRDCALRGDLMKKLDKLAFIEQLLDGLDPSLMKLAIIAVLLSRMA